MASVRKKYVWSLVVFILTISCIRTQDLDYTLQESPHPSREFKNHAVIKPRFYHGREKREITTTKSDNGEKHIHDLTVRYNLRGREHILDLRLNRELLSDTYFQKHQENGQHKIHQPLEKDRELCHYQGNLRGIPESWAAVSTCHGLRGVVFDGEELNYLEPKSSKPYKTDDGLQSPKEIILYKHSDIHERNLTCGYEGTSHDALKNVKLSGPQRFKRSSEASSDDDAITELRGPYNANKKSRYVELVLVVDHKLFVDLDENKEVVYQHCKDIANIINALYVPLNIFIALVGVVVWSEYDEIAIVPNGDTTLTNFLHYRRERLVKQHPNDNAQLLTRIQFENGVVGKALKGPICTYEFSGGVSMDHSNVVALVATTVAHEMGHNFGMEHDSSDCQCPSSRCIMAPSSSALNPTKWSSCSEKYLLLAFHQGMDYCLHNKPTKLFGSPVCGNGFVEPGEQCDCGLVDRCTNPCCNATTCMLHPNASCATGECCDFETCRPKIAGSVCRSADQECDLPEFCTGRSEFCPVDVFKMDGETCNHGKAFCYQGMCRTRSDQCKLLWGPSGKSSDTQCYKMNTKGTRHGNCGYNRINQSYVKCVDDNIFCGMLHCKHLNERLEFGMESVSILSHSFINAGGNIIPCRTAIVDLGLNQVDPGLAPDGSKCGEGKMCVNQKCMAVSSLRASIDASGCPQNCNGNGVCNSKGHCHCNPGFAPPFCDYPGTGGSEDSGPASDPNAGRRVMTALYIIFLGIVPFVALMALLMYYSRPLVKHWWKKPSTMSANGTRSATKPGGQNRTSRGNTLAFHSLDRSCGPKSNGTSGREISSPIRSDSTHASLLPRSETPVQTPSSSNDGSPLSNLQASLSGQFKGFSITPIDPASPTRTSVIASSSRPNQPSPTHQTALRKAPLPPTVPSTTVKAFPKPAAASKPAATSVNTSSAVKPQSSLHRPLISGPILDATTSATAKELAGGSGAADPVVAPVRPAPAVPTPVPTPAPVPAPAPAPSAVQKPSRPLSSPQEVVVIPPNSAATKQGSYPTLTKLASMLRSSPSFRGREDKRDEPHTVKAGKLLDKDKLRTLQISNPIPQQEIEVPNAVPVQRPSGPATAPAQAVVMRAQSMRSGALASRPAIQSFGSMRQPGKRPSSLASSSLHRPTSPPPPRPPPLPDVSTGIIGLPGYQNPPELKAKSKSPSDYSYDDCLNLVGEAPLAHIDEENSPTSGDNIYAVIEESPSQGARNRVNFSLPPSTGPEYISPTASEYKTPMSEEKIVSAGSCESMGLLGEIVSEIQARNTDSIYSTSSVNGKVSAENSSNDVDSGGQSTEPPNQPLASSGTYMNTTSSTPSSGYLRPKVTAAGPKAVGSSVGALKSPSTAAPGSTTTTTTKTITTAGLSATPVSTYKPYSTSLQSRGPLASTLSKTSPSVTTVSPPVSQKQTPGETLKPVESNSSFCASPDVVSSCSASADTSSPDVINPANLGKSAHLPTSNSKLMGVAKAQSSVPSTLSPSNEKSKSNLSVTSSSKWSTKPEVPAKGSSMTFKPSNLKPPVSATKPSLDSIGGQSRTQSPQARAEASKISNVASLQQKFETGSGGTKVAPPVKPRVVPSTLKSTNLSSFSSK